MHAGKKTVAVVRPRALAALEEHGQGLLDYCARQTTATGSLGHDMQAGGAKAVADRQPRLGPFLSEPQHIRQVPL